MALIQLNNVSLRGISAAIPKQSQEVKGLPFFSDEEACKFIAGTGVERRRLVEEGVTTSDLCYRAAEQLLAEMNWQRDEVDCLIFVSQTPDYILPATSCMLQERLKLREGLVAFDISLGCSGWVYGLFIMSNLLSGGQLKKGLLLVGDTISKTCSTDDKSTYPLFGDAGTATALEFDPQSQGFKFHLAADGSGAKAIIIPDGGYRNQYNVNSIHKTTDAEGISRTPSDLILDGMNVFSFGISKAPESINLLASHFVIDLETVDYFLFHQANKFMNEKIRKKLKIPADKVPYTLKDYGNTSSATIPFTFSKELGEIARAGKLCYIACGFGVGLSWGSVWFSTDCLICPAIIEV